MNIVCIGDSLTFGYGVEKEDNWVTILSKKYKENLINKGVPGNTTVDMNERFIKDVILNSPTKVFILGGINDLFLKKNVDSVLYNISKIVDLSKENGIIPVLLAPLNVNEKILEKQWFQDIDYGQVNKEVFKLREALCIYANKKAIDYIDLNSCLLEKINLENHFLSDGIHVSKEVHKKIAEIIESYINL